MGCHTWFYKKIKKLPSKKQFFDEIIKNIEKDIIFYNKLIYNRKEIDKDFLKSYPEFTIEFCKKHKKILFEYLSKAKKHIYIDEMSDFELNDIYLFDKIHYEKDKYHDIFRVQCYPTRILKSYKATIRYYNQCLKRKNTTIESEKNLGVAINKLSKGQKKKLKKIFSEGQKLINFG